MSNLRKETFTGVAGHLKEAVECMEKAKLLLKDSEYWSNTSEYQGIVNMIRRTKSMADDFLR